MYKLLLLLGSAALCLGVVKCELNLQEGAECEWNTEKDGVAKGQCVEKHRCFTTLDKRGDKPPVCSTKGDITIVCCTDCELVNDTSKVIIGPTSRIHRKDGRKFRDHCLHYLNDLPNKCPGYRGGISRHLETGKSCHTYSTWAVGGPPARGRRPRSVNLYEALVGFGESVETAKWKTSGAIISDKYILTSGFDTKHTDGLSPKFVAVGVKDHWGAGDNWQTRSVHQVHVHPQYSRNSPHYYVALLELDEALTFNRDVFPACLPDPLAAFDSSIAEYTPFVDPTLKGNVFEDSRHKLKVPALTAEACNTQLTSSTEWPHGIDVNTQLCYGNQDHCQMVLGSPIVVSSYLDRCVNTVLGVKVWGGDCGPAVFASTAALLPWIESIVWP